MASGVATKMPKYSAPPSLHGPTLKVNSRKTSSAHAGCQVAISALARSEQSIDLISTFIGRPRFRLQGQLYTARMLAGIQGHRWQIRAISVRTDICRF